MILRLSIFLFFLMSQLSYGQAPSISDADVQKIGFSDSVTIPLGKVVVTSSTADFYNKIIPESYFKSFIRPAEQIGIVVFTEDEDMKRLRAGEYLPQAFLEKSRGVVTRGIVALTERGKSVTGATDSTPFLVIKGSSWSSIKVIKKEVRQFGMNWYATAFLSFRLEPTAILNELRTNGAPNVSPDRKAIKLFKYDEFKSGWMPVTFDVADFNGSFPTQNVESALAKLSH